MASKLYELTISWETWEAMHAKAQRYSYVVSWRGADVTVRTYSRTLARLLKEAANA